MSQYKIADLNIDFSGLDYDYFKARMKEYFLVCTQDCDISISYSDNKSITLPKGKRYKKIHRWEWIETEDSKFAAFKQLPVSKIIISLIESDRDWKKVSLQLFGIENDFGITNETRSFITAGEIFAYSILKHNGLVLHSSAIDYDGNAIIFSAPSGTGKSTHTELWRKYYGGKTKIINDDSPAIRLIDNKPYAFGTPWSGKTEINCNCSAPLKAIVFLERGTENNIREIKGAEAVSLMLNETRKPVFAEMMDLTLEIINKIICNTPIYILSCDISKQAVDIVKDALGF